MPFTSQRWSCYYSVACYKHRCPFMTSTHWRSWPVNGTSKEVLTRLWPRVGPAGDHIPAWLRVSACGTLCYILPCCRQLPPISLEGAFTSSVADGTRLGRDYTTSLTADASLRRWAVVSCWRRMARHTQGRHPRAHTLYALPRCSRSERPWCPFGSSNELSQRYHAQHRAVSFIICYLYIMVHIYNYWG